MSKELQKRISRLRAEIKILKGQLATTARRLAFAEQERPNSNKVHSLKRQLFIIGQELKDRKEYLARLLAELEEVNKWQVSK